MLSFAFTDEQLAYRAELARYARTRLLAYLVADGTSEIQKRIIAKDVFRAAAG